MTNRQRFEAKINKLKLITFHTILKICHCHTFVITTNFRINIVNTGCCKKKRLRLKCDNKFNMIYVGLTMF